MICKCMYKIIICIFSLEREKESERERERERERFFISEFMMLTD